MSHATDALTKITSEVSQATWDDLLPHLERGGLLHAASLDLVPAALAIALDRVDDVRQWLQSGALVASAGLAKDAFASTTAVEFVIVQPYVLFRILPN